MELDPMGLLLRNDNEGEGKNGDKNLILLLFGLEEKRRKLLVTTDMVVVLQFRISTFTG